MAEEKNNQEPKIKAKKSDLVGRLAEPVPLSDKTKIDVDITKTLTDHLIMAGLSGKIDTTQIEKFTTISDARDSVYSQLDTMCTDSSVSAVVRTIMEDVCEIADNGHIVWAESNNPNISKYVNYLLNVANVDKNISGWAYSLIKYGDLYLKLFRESDYEDDLFDKSRMNRPGKLMEQLAAKDAQDAAKEGKLEQLNENIYLNIHKASDPYSYHMEMVADPGTMFELTKHGETAGFIEVPNEKYTLQNQEAFAGATGLGSNAQISTVGQFNYKMKSNDINIYQADDYVHAFLEDGLTRFPETVDIFIPDEEATTNVTSGKTASYVVRRGKSLLHDAYKVWREKTLLEGAVLLSRLTRSSVIRKVGVEMGNTSREKSSAILRSVKEMFEQKTAISKDNSMSEYTNPSAVENFVYYAIRNNVGQITVENVGGDYDPKSLVDLDNWNTRFYSAFGIPKQYFGWTEDGAGFNGGTALTVLSSVYGKSVKRIQNALIQALSTAIDLFLLDSGCPAYLNNYTLKMKTPLTQEEISYRENLSNRANAISSLNSLFNDVETKSTRLGILKDLVSTLNYGDDLLAKIDDEIKLAKEAEAKAKEEEEQAKLAEEQAANGEEQTAPEEPVDLGVTETSEAPETGGDEDLNVSLDSLPSAPDTPQESFTNNGGSMSLTEDTEFLDEDTDLPNPDSLEDIDFSENK